MSRKTDKKEQDMLISFYYLKLLQIPCIGKKYDTRDSSNLGLI